VKLCSKNQHTENKEFCLTSLEVWDVSSGILMGSTGVRQIEGEQGLHLLVSLTTSYSIMIPKGLHLTVDKGKPVPMPFSFCVPLFCQTQIELTKELLDSLRSGKEIVVSGDSVQGRPIGFRAPLNGFSKAHDGIPLDPALYQEAQRRLKEMIRKRQIELANRTDEGQQKKEQGQQPEAQPQPGAQAPAQPAPNGMAAQQKKPDIQVNP
jgi:invasion protein IalB